MKFNSVITVVGMKSSKGTLENGNGYDSTKVFALVDLDSRKGDAKGQAVGEYTLGLSDEFRKFEHLPFPFHAQAEFEILTSGKVQKTILLGLKPVAAQKAA